MAKHHLRSNEIINSKLKLVSFCVGFIFQWLLQETVGSQCGIVDIVVPQILNGTQTQKGEWPFLAALFRVENFEFFCGGTVISTKHVLTAAHCIHWKHSSVKLLPTDVIVLLGAYDLTKRNDRGVVERHINEIYVHPEWDIYSEKFDADIAIIVLHETIKFSNFIRPVCMPTADVDGVRGIIVGWGLMEKEIESHLHYPRHAYTNTLNDSYCYTADPIVAMFSSPRTFCCGHGGGSPNSGDSGGGFFVLSGTVWVQYGIISSSRINATGIVDGKSFSVYTNVKLFRHWIDETVVNSGGVVLTGDTVEEKIILNCDYYEGIEKGYTCKVLNLDIRQENLQLSSFTGSHESGKSELDVQRMLLLNGTMFYLPDCIGSIFKNLKDFTVDKNVRIKKIKRSNFKNLENLISLLFNGNDIVTINEDTLWDLPNLKEFELYYNKLKVLHERTFERNSKLTDVHMKYNQLEFLPKNLFKNNLLLERVTFVANFLQLIDTDFTHLKNVRNLFFYDNICIDAIYDRDNLFKTRNHYDNLIDFQNLITANCSLLNPLI